MRQMTEQAVEAHDISKRFGAVTAVDGLSLTRNPAPRLGFWGRTVPASQPRLPC